MKRLKWLVRGSVLCLFLVACEDASNTVISVPSVNVECSNSENSECGSSLNGRNAFVVLSRSGCPSDQEYFEVAASGSATLSCGASGCTAFVSTWQDGITEMVSGSTDLCAYLDANGNATIDSGELVHNSTTSINSGSTITIDSWSTQ